MSKNERPPFPGSTMDIKSTKDNLGRAAREVEEAKDMEFLEKARAKLMGLVNAVEEFNKLGK